ncbi:hypothetical protein GUJ93_ZPchr0004g38253 [Zizania palustris]|uniref:Uncharacterized protein n=1 Tax=Zizania palustris TaxID=103762 RepID=A0A8J5S614_ZIZPA|nr:hypothetical protein GUJ93_ZPchr0004g38253 [Zizania palustris]
MRERTLGAVIKVKDEELALFLKMCHHEKERGTAAAATATKQLMWSGDDVDGTREGMLLIDPSPMPLSSESFGASMLFARFCSCICARGLTSSDAISLPLLRYIIE